MSANMIVSLDTGPRFIPRESSPIPPETTATADFAKRGVVTAGIAIMAAEHVTVVAAEGATAESHGGDRSF